MLLLALKMLSSFLSLLLTVTAQKHYSEIELIPENVWPEDIIKTFQPKLEMYASNRAFTDM